MNLDKDFNEVCEEFNKSNGLTKSDQANENMLSSESNIGEDTSENKIDLLNYIKEQIEEFQPFEVCLQYNEKESCHQIKNESIEMKTSDFDATKNTTLEFEQISTGSASALNSSPSTPTKHKKEARKVYNTRKRKHGRPAKPKAKNEVKIEISPRKLRKREVKCIAKIEYEDDFDSTDDEKKKEKVDREYKVQSYCKTDKMNELGNTLQNIIVSAMTNIVKTEEIVVKKRGRPKEKRDFSIKKMKEQFEEKWEDIQSLKIGKEQRIDAKNATVARALKRIPLFFLMKFGSRCMYKSKDIKHVLSEYLLIFNECFQKFYGKCNKNEKYRVFFDCITCCFPQKKLVKLFEALRYANCTILNESLYEKYVELINLRNKTSLNSFKSFAEKNKAFKIILNKTPAKLSNISKDILECIKSVVRSIKP